MKLIGLIGGLSWESSAAYYAVLNREAQARLKDPDGNEICLYHAGVNRLDPPWRARSGPSAA